MLHRNLLTRDNQSFRAGSSHPDRIGERSGLELLHLVVEKRRGDGHLPVRAVRTDSK